jgi:hypothetical protein
MADSNRHSCLVLYLKQAEELCKDEEARDTVRFMREELDEYDGWQAKLAGRNHAAREAAQRWLTNQGREIVGQFQGYVHSLRRGLPPRAQGRDREGQWAEFE